jgi:hypothetical protein
MLDVLFRRYGPSGPWYHGQRSFLDRSHVHDLVAAQACANQELVANRSVSSGYFLYLNQVDYFLDHTTNRRMILVFNRLLEFV